MDPAWLSAIYYSEDGHITSTLFLSDLICSHCRISVCCSIPWTLILFQRPSSLPLPCYFALYSFSVTPGWISKAVIATASHERSERAFGSESPQRAHQQLRMTCSRSFKRCYVLYFTLLIVDSVTTVVTFVLKTLGSNSRNVAGWDLKYTTPLSFLLLL